jgi:hypothetical protein
MLSIDRGESPEVPTGFPSPSGRVPTDLAYRIALHRIEGLRSGPLWRLIRAFGDLSLAWTAPRAELERAGLTADVAAAVVAGRAGTDPVEAHAELEAEGATAMVWHDPAYPHNCARSQTRRHCSTFAATWRRPSLSTRSRSLGPAG